MTAHNSSVRYERKWVPAGRPLAEVLLAVRRHPAAFRTVFPERQVNNVYFDTPSLSHYHDHVAGSSERLKVRLRWYGSFDGDLPHPVLELKFKRGSASWKESFPLPPIRLADLLGRAAAPNWWGAADLPEFVRLRLRSLRPTLANHYRRYYFRAAADGIRLTVDTQLSFLDTRPAGSSLRRLVYPTPPTIMELKYDDAHTETAERVAHRLPFRMTRCSKYVLGIQHLDGH
jgi:hypothetical protein